MTRFGGFFCFGWRAYIYYPHFLCLGDCGPGAATEGHGYLFAGTIWRRPLFTGDGH